MHPARNARLFRGQDVVWREMYPSFQRRLLSRVLARQYRTYLLKAWGRRWHERTGRRQVVVFTRVVVSCKEQQTLALLDRALREGLAYYDVRCGRAYTARLWHGAYNCIRGAKRSSHD